MEIRKRPRRSTGRPNVFASFDLSTSYSAWISARAATILPNACSSILKGREGTLREKVIRPTGGDSRHRTDWPVQKLDSGANDPKCGAPSSLSACAPFSGVSCSSNPCRGAKSQSIESIGLRGSRRINPFVFWFESYLGPRFTGSATHVYRSFNWWGSERNSLWRR